MHAGPDTSLPLPDPPPRVRSAVVFWAKFLLISILVLLGVAILTSPMVGLPWGHGWGNIRRAQLANCASNLRQMYVAQRGIAADRTQQRGAWAWGTLSDGTPVGTGSAWWTIIAHDNVKEITDYRLMRCPITGNAPCQNECDYRGPVCDPNAFAEWNWLGRDRNNNHGGVNTNDPWNAVTRGGEVLRVAFSATSTYRSQDGDAQLGD